LLHGVQDTVQYDVREYSARAINAMGVAANVDKVRDVLIARVLTDRNFDVRLECANAVSAIHAWDDKLVLDLCQRLQDKAEDSQFRKNVSLLIGKLDVSHKPYKSQIVQAFSAALQDEKDDSTRLEIGKVLNDLVHASNKKGEEAAAPKTDYDILYNRRSVARVKLLSQMRKEAPILAELEDLQNPWLL